MHKECPSLLTIQNYVVVGSGALLHQFRTADMQAPSHNIVFNFLKA
jgi:hypothetical protein